jgi:adenylate cyclase
VDPVLCGSDLCCGVCGNSLRASARFCDACGSPVGLSRAVAERKQITVLFSDVVGSMELAATLDPERLREIMHELFNRSATVVQRYQGTVDKFTGDGLMALFGAPVALEDHALRACITALEIQSLARRLAADVLRRDHVVLQIRIGVNSGEVIAGDIGVGPGSYTAVGHPVGMAQRMEAAADPGGVMCTASTARLVEHSALLGPVEWVTVKGASERISARRLEGVESDRTMMGRDEGPLMGRDADLDALLDAFNGGQTSVVCVVGEPGLGKSRLIREFASRATTTGAEIVITRCESHTANVPLHALSRTLRAMFGIRRLDAAAARAHIAAQLEEVTESDSGDSDILFDLLSISDPDATPPTMSADGRRRRIIEVMGKVAENRPARTLFVVEDIHWVDAASEEVLAMFAATLTGTQSMFVGSFRPEYHGPVRDTSGTTITLAPLNDSTTLALTAELVGQHPTVLGVAKRIALPSGGNPFFVEEIVRDLVGRGFLLGNRGDYRLVGDLDAIAVPATVQSVLAARIDRLSIPEKSILNAGAVIGSSFDVDILEVLLPSVESRHLRSLVSAELIDQIQFLPEPRYAFRHPLVRAVSYESQLSATRADGHTRLAAAIEARNPAAVEENSALIAQHLEAAGELGAAYAWYMRSADWLRLRDVMGARDSWERARAIADRLPADQEGVTGKRIAPRALLTFTGWQVGSAAGSDRWFDELRELATQSGDLLSLAMGMSGRVDSLLAHGRLREASVMASELLVLVDKVNGTASEKAEMLLSVAFAQFESGEFGQALRTTDRLREMARGLTGSELAPASCMAGVIKSITGRRADGRRDLDAGLRLAREDHPVTYAAAVAWKTDLVVLGFELVDEALVSATRHALLLAESIGDAYGLSIARWAHGTALLRSGDTDRSAGVDLLHQSRSGGMNSVGSWCDAELSAEMARQGRRDTPIDTLRAAVQSEIDAGDRLFVGYSTVVLVQLLVSRGAATDLDQARDIVAQLEAQLPRVPEPALQLWPLQCRALLANAVGDLASYSEIVTRYRDLAEELDARGHLAVAKRLAAEPAFGG